MARGLTGGAATAGRHPLRVRAGVQTPSPLRTRRLCLESLGAAADRYPGGAHRDWVYVVSDRTWSADIGEITCDGAHGAGGGASQKELHRELSAPALEATRKGVDQAEALAIEIESLRQRDPAKAAELTGARAALLAARDAVMEAVECTPVRMMVLVDLCVIAAIKRYEIRACPARWVYPHSDCGLCVSSCSAPPPVSQVP
jgi:hypothetical protein